MNEGDTPCKCLFVIQLLVLKYVQNKDVFMRYHKAHLTRRLILDSSADNEKEENMVEWLRVGITEFNAVINDKYLLLLLGLLLLLLSVST